MKKAQNAAVTAQLDESVRSRRDVVDGLFVAVYDELRGRAHGHRLGWEGDHTLGTTALVHEAYLKLAGQDGATWQSREHFLALAAKAMRHILVDHARRRSAAKRGGRATPLPLEDVEASTATPSTDDDRRAEMLIVLDRAIERLERLDPRQARVVECRFFGGMSVEEASRVLRVSPRTVKRDWAHAQAWLRREVQGSQA